MKEQFFKVTQKILLMTFMAFIIAINLDSTAFAANPKVTNLKQVEGTTTKITVSWDAPLGAKGFDIYLSEDKTFPENGTIIEHSSSAIKWITGLNPNRSYYVKVIPQNSANNTQYDFSDIIECVTAPEYTGKGTHINSTDSSVTISWTAPASGAQYYKIYHSPAPIGKELTFAGSSYNTNFTIRNLTDNSLYDIRVYPIRKSESGFEAVGAHSSASWQATISQAATTAKANKLSQIKLDSWNAGSNTATISVRESFQHQSGIEMEICSLDGKKIKKVTTSLNYTHLCRLSFSSNKIKNKGFKYRLRSYVTVGNKKCYGPYTTQKTVIAHPKVTASKKSATSLKLNWKKISGAKNYTIYVANKQWKFKKVATTKSTSYILKKTKINKDYYIYVKANYVKVGTKKCSSTKAVKQPVTKVRYTNSNISNNYITYTK